MYIIGNGHFQIRNPCFQDYTHADIKAANILLEKADDFSTCVLADYGIAHLSSSNEDKPVKKRAHDGTAIFTSCDAHRGCHPSYRGDLEILAYNMVYWLTGTLPWEACVSKPDKVYQMKKAFLKGLPSSLNELLKVGLFDKIFSQINFPSFISLIEKYKVLSSSFRTSRKMSCHWKKFSL
ncbi:unnamed protein product [Haemonchus placei]|uniref:non-specific serine/threonine protein kinase n=1 Tax=Haemonchus placei TaxID=6290 RepID=A0A0N4X5N3_HAEPC|nr:unnamed protein product [Haemonchus placei]